MNLKINKPRILQAVKAARDEAIGRVETVCAELQQEIELAAAVLADHPEQFPILNADAVFVIDGELQGYNRRFSIQLDGGRAFNHLVPPEEIRVPPGHYRAIVLFIKRGPVDKIKAPP